jgi:hypothetical protein
MATATQLGPIESPNLLSGTTDTTYQLHLADPVGNLAMLEATANTGYALQNFMTPTQHWALGVGGSVTTTAPDGAFYLFDNTDAMGPLLTILPGSGDVDFVGSVRSYGPHQVVDLTESNVTVGTGSGSGIPAIALVSAVGALDEKIWFIDAGHYTFQIRTTMDDESADNIWFAAVRSGLVIESVTISTALLAISGTVTASDAQFATCEVANSPVRTFANTADGEGPDYPPAGIGISTGTAWNANSIDPSTLATWPGVGIPVSTGSAWGASINPATLATFPAAGVAVSTGSAWATPIDPTRIPLLGQANYFSYVQSFQGITVVMPYAPLIRMLLTPDAAAGAFSPIVQGGDNVISFDNNGALDSAALAIVSTSSANSIGVRIDGVNKSSTWYGDLITQTNAVGAIPIPNNGCRTTWNIGAGVGETDFINGYPVGSGATGGFRWYSGATGSNITSASVPLMSLTGNGVVIASQVQCNYLYAGGSGSTIFGFQPNMPAGSSTSILTGQTNTAGNVAALGFLYQGNNSSSNRGQIWFPGYSQTSSFDALGNWYFAGGAQAALSVMALGQSALAPGNIRMSFIGGSGYLDAFGTSTTGAAPMNIRVVNSNGTTVFTSLALDGLGNVHAYGTLSAGTKSFRITHPLDDEKWLVHGSLEGPEYGVYYRGEGVTVDSWAEVELPDYFEALTMQEGRTVYLTPFFEDDTELCSTVAASRVKDGRFKVWSALPAQKFYWMVMAVRGDVPELVVEQERLPDPPSTIVQPVQPIENVPTEPLPPAPAPTTPNEESDDEQASTDQHDTARAAKRSGTAKDGKLHTAPRSHAAAASGRADRPGRTGAADRR